MQAKVTRSGLAVFLLAVALVSAMPTQAADLVEVFGVVENQFPGPGGDPVVQVEWGVRNISAGDQVSVVLNAYIVYSNGLRQQVFPPETTTLGPMNGIIRLGFVIIPGSAASGTATFHAEARVQRVVGDGDGSGTLVSDVDTFEVP